MKYTIRIIVLTFILVSFQMCAVKSNGQWKSQKNNLQLNFTNKWELIHPILDTDKKTLVGVKDNNDNSSFIIKITEDVSKELLSDDNYLDIVQEQMLSTNSENKLLIRDKIVFNKTEFNRMIFFMKTKFGKVIHTVYTHRNGDKIIGIQFSYPEALNENPIENTPAKIDTLLKGVKFNTTGLTS